MTCAPEHTNGGLGVLANLRGEREVRSRRNPRIALAEDVACWSRVPNKLWRRKRERSRFASRNRLPHCDNLFRHFRCEWRRECPELFLGREDIFPEEKFSEPSRHDPQQWHCHEGD